MCEWDGERKGATDIGIKCENIFSREREITIPAGGSVVFLLFIRSISPWLLHFHLIAVGHRFGLFCFSFLMDFVRDMMKRSNRPSLMVVYSLHVERHLYYISKWRTQRDVYPSTCVFYTISPLNLSAFCTHVSNVWSTPPMSNESTSCLILSLVLQGQIVNLSSYLHFIFDDRIAPPQKNWKHLATHRWRIHSPSASVQLISIRNQEKRRRCVYRVYPAATRVKWQKEKIALLFIMRCGSRTYYA